MFPTVAMVVIDVIRGKYAKNINDVISILENPKIFRFVMKKSITNRTINI